jgi:hypothetical protein
MGFLREKSWLQRESSEVLGKFTFEVALFILWKVSVH